MRDPGETEAHPEAECSPGGNHGLCRTHPTCEMVREKVESLEADVMRLEPMRARHKALLAAIKANTCNGTIEAAIFLALEAYERDGPK